MGKVVLYMRLDPTMSSILNEIDGTYSTYTDNRGSTVVRLEKALYGCVESAALWYNNLSAVIVPGPGSRSYRVPTLPDPTGYYYCTLQLGCRIVVAIYSVHLEVNQLLA